MRQESYDNMVKTSTMFMTKYAPVFVFFSVKFELYKGLFVPATVLWILAVLALSWARFVDRGGIIYRVLASFGICVQSIMFFTFLGRGGGFW